MNRKLFMLGMGALAGLVLFRYTRGCSAGTAAETADSLTTVWQTKYEALVERNDVDMAAFSVLKGRADSLAARTDTLEDAFESMEPAVDSVLVLVPDTVRIIIRAAIDTLKTAVRVCKLGLTDCIESRKLAEAGWQRSMLLLAQADTLAAFNASTIRKLDRYRPRGADQTLDLIRLGGCAALGYGVAEGEGIVMGVGGGICGGLTLKKLLFGR